MDMPGLPIPPSGGVTTPYGFSSAPMPSDPYSFNGNYSGSSMPNYPVTYQSSSPYTNDTGYSTSAYGAVPGAAQVPSLPGYANTSNYLSTSPLQATPAGQSVTPYAATPYAGSGIPEGTQGPNAGGDFGNTSNIPPGNLNSTAGLPASLTGPGGNSSIPWDQIFNTQLGQEQLGQQQQWLTYMINSYMPAQLQMQQQAAAIQNQLNQAAATGDYQGQQTLQAQLQQANINLANYQANMQGLLSQAGVTGVMNGNPTMQAQQLMNQYAALGGNQYLTARGQDLGYDQALMNFATQQGQLQEQLATSPLVAWYTARGLPPPTSAYMGGSGQGGGGSGINSSMPTFMQLYNAIPQFQGLGQYQAPNYNWSFPNTPNALPNLPTTMTSGNGTASNVTSGVPL